MSKILANQIANYGDDAPIEIKEGLNIPAGKPIQAAGNAGTSGQVLSSTGTTIQWTTPFNGDYNALANLPTIPAAQVNADWNATSGVSSILNKPVVPPIPSVVTNSAGAASLAYNSFNGQFTYTPPDLSNYDTAYGWGDHAAAGYWVDNSASRTNWDLAYSWGNHALSGYLTAETDPVFAASDAAAVTAAKITNWDTAYGWGDHGAVGYLTSVAVEDISDVDLSTPPTDGQVLKWEAASSSWKPANDQVSGLGGGITLSDLSVTTNTAGTAALSYNDQTGVFTYTPPDVSGYLTTETDPVFSASPAATILNSSISNWDAAYGWGNHALAGYASSASVANASNWDTAYSWGDHALAGYLTSLGDAAGVTTAKIAQWDTAYGWGDHSTAGYQLTSSNSLGGLNNVTITNPSTNDVLSYNGAGWVNSSASVVAKATISDTAPGSAVAGDLWWESDTGRLKIYYNDTDSTQWVDASPPLADATSIGGSGTVSMKAHLIPDTNNAYDIGSAEYKIRDLYINNNSIHTESGKSMSFEGGNLMWGGDDVIMLQDLKDMMMSATSFEDFKNAIMGL